MVTFGTIICTKGITEGIPIGIPKRLYQCLSLMNLSEGTRVTLEYITASTKQSQNRTVT